MTAFTPEQRRIASISHIVTTLVKTCHVTLEGTKNHPLRSGQNFHPALIHDVVLNYRCCEIQGEEWMIRFVRECEAYGIPVDAIMEEEDRLRAER